MPVREAQGRCLPEDQQQRLSAQVSLVNMPANPMDEESKISDTWGSVVSNRLTEKVNASQNNGGGGWLCLVFEARWGPYLEFGSW